MPTLEQAPRIGEHYIRSEIIELIDKKLAGRALYLTVQEPANPQTAGLLSEQPGVLANRIDSDNDLSWQLWHDHVAAEQTYGENADSTSAHFSIILGNDDAVIYQYQTERSSNNA